MKKVDPKLTAAAYIRVSTPSQADEEKISLVIQQEAIEKYTKEKGLTIYNIYEDHESGQRADRTNYVRMKRDAEAGHFKKVIFDKWDRFGRSTKEMLNVHDELKMIGVDLVCVSESVDTSTPYGRHHMIGMASSAELELSKIKGRIIDGLKARARKGLRIGMAPFGYKWIEDEKKFEIDKDESKVYQRMVRDYLVKGKSQTQIAVDLNEKGIKSSYKRRWTQISVSTILHNPVYKGTFSYHFDGRRYEIPCPPLIDRKEWDLIQQRIKDNWHKSRNYNKRDDPFLLRDLIRCGECGYGMFPDTVRSRGQSWRYYVCYIGGMSSNRRKASNVEKTCSLPSIPAEEIEQEVLKEIKKYFIHPKKLIDLWAKRIDSENKEELENEQKSRKIKLGKFEAKREKDWAFFFESGISREEIVKRERALDGLIEKLKSDIIEGDKEIDLIQSREEDLKRISATAKEMEKLTGKVKMAFEKMPNDQLKAFLREALAGHKLRVRILRRRDVDDDEDIRSMSKEQLNKPLIDTTRPGPKTFAWTVDFGWIFDLQAASQYLKPLTKLNNCL